MPTTEAANSPVSLVKWIFVRNGQMFTCEVRANREHSYDLCIVPHWDIDATVIEPYSRCAEALQRHAEVAASFRDAGWARLCERAGRMAAA
jgi:hypothetical protein